MKGGGWGREGAGGQLYPLSCIVEPEGGEYAPDGVKKKNEGRGPHAEFHAEKALVGLIGKDYKELDSRWQEAQDEPPIDAIRPPKNRSEQ